MFSESSKTITIFIGSIAEYCCNIIVRTIESLMHYENSWDREIKKRNVWPENVERLKISLRLKFQEKNKLKNMNFMKKFVFSRNVKPFRKKNREKDALNFNETSNRTTSIKQNNCMKLQINPLFCVQLSSVIFSVLLIRNAYYYFAWT